MVAIAATSSSSSSRIRLEKPDARAPRHLEVVVVEADGAVAERHAQHDPDVRVAQVGPQQRRHSHAGDDHEAAHGRRADLGRCVFGPSSRIGWPLPCLTRKQVDDAGSEQHHEQQRGEDGAAGAEGDVAENVQRPDLVAEVHQLVEHSTSPTRPVDLGSRLSVPTRAPTTRTAPSALRASASTSGAMRDPSEPLIITTSPARTASQQSGPRISAERGAHAPRRAARQRVDRAAA